MPVVKISPSILACDFTRLGEEAARMQQAGADMLHLDIMDGHFVPNISFGPPVIKALRGKTDIFFDVHLMLTNPLDYVEAFAKAGADMITFHVESASPVIKTLEAIKAFGIKCGLTVKPKTPVEAIREYLPMLDMALIMTVEPGFGGQAFMDDMLPKIELLRSWCDTLDIEVDGGINPVTGGLCAKAGANVLVAGSSLFSAGDYAAAVSELRHAAHVGNSN